MFCVKPYRAKTLPFTIPEFKDSEKSALSFLFSEFQFCALHPPTVGRQNKWNALGIYWKI